MFLRPLLLIEAATFAIASLIHFGALLDGYEHRRAGIAEAVIAVVLVAGWALSRGRSPRRWTFAVGAQVFALVGVLVGLFTIAIGVGPRTVPDVTYRLVILAVLAGSLFLVVRRVRRFCAGRGAGAGARCAGRRGPSAGAV